MSGSVSRTGTTSTGASWPTGAASTSGAGRGARSRGRPDPRPASSNAPSTRDRVRRGAEQAEAPGIKTPPQPLFPGPKGRVGGGSRRSRVRREIPEASGSDAIESNRTDTSPGGRRRGSGPGSLRSGWGRQGVGPGPAPRTEPGGHRRGARDTGARFRDLKPRASGSKTSALRRGLESPTRPDGLGSHRRRGRGAVFPGLGLRRGQGPRGLVHGRLPESHTDSPNRAAGNGGRGRGSADRRGE